MLDLLAQAEPPVAEVPAADEYGDDFEEYEEDFEADDDGGDGDIAAAATAPAPSKEAQAVRWRVVSACSHCCS